MPKVSILVPFRGDGGERDRLWDYCRHRWQAMKHELVIGEDPGSAPFNISRAFNDAASRATGDIFVLFGADQIPDPDRVAWAATQLETHKWCALFAATGGLSRGHTHAILNGHDPFAGSVTSSAPFCTSIIGIRADSWIRFDERFYGWGGEDTAWRMVLETLYGPTPEPSGMLRCLFHKPASREHTDHNFALIGEYITAQAEGRMLEYVTGLGLL
jgi:hypothetical protein